MKLLGNTKNVIDKDKNGERVPKLEIVEIVGRNSSISTL